jgi:hypothetical protein
MQGTTLVYIATDAYTKYVAATGAVLDSSAGLLAITEEQYEALEPLVFDLGAAGTHSLSPNAQIWPRALNEEIGGNSSAIYLVVNDVRPLPLSITVRVRVLMHGHSWEATLAKASTSSTAIRSSSGSTRSTTPLTRASGSRRRSSRTRPQTECASTFCRLRLAHDVYAFVTLHTH